MAKITIVMHYTQRAREHIIDPSFAREGALARHQHVTWDTIQHWVAEGNEVTIRPPTDEERAAHQSSR